MATRALSVAELVALESTGPNSFATAHNPVRMGNDADIAYGGCAIAFATKAAASTVCVNTYRIYSVLGHFLSGAKADRRLHASVTSLRNTTSFATRTVLVTQLWEDGSSRSILSAHIDFHRIEPSSLLIYSVSPPEQAQCLSESWDRDRTLREMKLYPGSSDALVQMFEKAFEPATRFFEQRAVPDSIATQNMYGLLKRAETSQDHLPLTEKGSFDWSRSRKHLQSYSDHVSTIAFFMDGAISFIPLTHSRMFLQDAKSCSSLDFALRFFKNEPDFNKWHLRELRTIVGSCGRTYSTARLFDEDGKLVAEMSQQSIMRPHRESKPSL